jgi:GAF domain-containing protein
MMRSPFLKPLQKCADVQSVLTCALAHSLDITDTNFGNVQLMDWKSGYLEIKAQRGFQSEFLNFFERVEVGQGSACARALRHHDVIIIDDIMVDRQFAPYTEIVVRAGVRAVQSIPLVSRSGALVGILSNHFTRVHRPTDSQLRGMRELAEVAGNAIIRIRATNGDGRVISSLHLLQESHEAILKAKELLSPARGARIGHVANS